MQRSLISMFAHVNFTMELFFLEGPTLTRTNLICGNVDTSICRIYWCIRRWWKEQNFHFKADVVKGTWGWWWSVLPYIAVSFNVRGHLPPGRNVYIKLYYQGDEVCGRHGSCCCCYINVRLIMPGPCICVFALPSNIRQTQINYLVCLRKVKCFLEKDQLLIETIRVGVCERGCMCVCVCVCVCVCARARALEK